MKRNHFLALLLFIVTALLSITAMRPYDRATWVMEVAPVLIATPILLLTFRRFPLTSLLYALIALHAVVLIFGGAYTYARVPLGFWLQEVLALDRNPYDRIGHFMQGFVPALIAREVLLRGGYISNRRMAAFLSLCVVMAISAWYELIEWGAAIALGQAANDFLGTQGDAWDTQWDMFTCFIGGVTALLLLVAIQDRQMEKLEEGLKSSAVLVSKAERSERWYHSDTTWAGAVQGTVRKPGLLLFLSSRIRFSTPHSHY